MASFTPTRRTTRSARASDFQSGLACYREPARASRLQRSWPGEELIWSGSRACGTQEHIRPFPPRPKEVPNMTKGVGGQSPANVTHHLKGIEFPAGKEDLVEQAEENGADQEVLDVIRQMPDQDYGSMADVMKGYGEVG